MLKTLISVIFTVLLVSGCKSKKKTQDGADQQLMRLNNLYDSALIRHDTATLKRLYAEDFVYTNPEGKVLTRQEQVTSIAVSEVNWESGRSEDVKVKIFDNTAVMTGAFLAKGNYRGNPLTIQERYTAVWIKTDTSWQMVAEQGNIIK
jgi:ketosteroid isomerase-like protein